MNIWQVRIWVWLPPVVVHQSCEDITLLVIFTEKVGRFLQQPESSCARTHRHTHSAQRITTRVLRNAHYLGTPTWL